MLETLLLCTFWCRVVSCRVVSPAASDDDDDVDAVDDAVVSKCRDARGDDLVYLQLSYQTQTTSFLKYTDGIVLNAAVSRVTRARAPIRDAPSSCASSFCARSTSS